MSLESYEYAERGVVESERLSQRTFEAERLAPGGDTKYDGATAVIRTGADTNSASAAQILPGLQIVDGDNVIGKPSKGGQGRDSAGLAPGADGGQSERIAGQSESAGAQAAYGGEGLKRSVAPRKQYEVEAGDTLEKLAVQQLGKDATKDEIAKYIKEIAHENHLSSPPVIKPGDKLDLPGHTKDGGYVTTPETGVTKVVWPDGTVRTNYPDQHWVMHKPEAGDGYKEQHGGHLRPEENFTLVRMPDGSYYRTETLDDKPNQWDRSMGSKMEMSGHKELDQLAEAKIKDPEKLAKFRADMARFEERMHDRDLASLEVSATYEQVKRLLTAEGDKPLTADQRIKLAQQVMSQAATPDSVDQGGHPTCNVATVESRTYQRNPAEAARLVSDVALTGQYKANDGTTVKIDPTSLQPDMEASAMRRSDGYRSHASQLFQVTAVNVGLEQENQKTDPPRQLRYEQKRGNGDGDSGDRLMDHSTNPPREIYGNDDQPARAPQLKDRQIVDISNAITGEARYNDVLLAHKDAKFAENDADRGGVTSIGSEADLNKKLEEIARSKQLPVIVHVDSNCEPFWTENIGKGKLADGGPHVVTITGYEAGPPAKVHVNNQWGSKSDHPMTVHDLYVAMQGKDNPETVKELKKEIEANKATPDALKEFELVRFERKPDAKEYAEEVKRIMVEEEKRYKQRAPKDPDHPANEEEQRIKDEHDKAVRCFRLMLKQIPDERQQDDVIRAVKEQNPQDEILNREMAQHLLARRRRSSGGLVIQ